MMPLVCAVRAIALPLLLAGLLPLDSGTDRRWPPCGAFLYPVGDPYALEVPDGAPPYHVLRGFDDSRHAARAHRGADLGNGRGGDAAHAAANGLVVQALGVDDGKAFGAHVVLAHRVSDGALIYTVYAHLAPGTVRVRPGQSVAAGEVVGRVGHSGNATTDHLHFEVHVADEPTLRWEKTRAVDPCAFVAARLPLHRSDRLPEDAAIRWAECAGIVQGDAEESRLSRVEWHTMLGRSVRPRSGRAPDAPESLGVYLAGLGLRRPLLDPAGAVEWSEVGADLKWLKRVGTALPPPPSPGAAPAPRAPAPTWKRRLEAARAGALPPTLATACVAIASVVPAKRTASTRPHRGKGAHSRDTGSAR